MSRSTRAWVRCALRACLVASPWSGLAIGCHGDATQSAAVSRGDLAPCATRVVAVEADSVAPSVRIVGVVEPLRRASPAARVMATAISADFREGQRVRHGQVLVQLDTRDLTASRGQARAARESTQTALELARTHAERMRQLHASGDVSRPLLEQAQAALAHAEAGAASAVAAVDTVDVNISYARVVAPFDGVVALRLVEVGNLVAPGQPVAVIEDDARLRVVAPIGSDLATGVVPGQQVAVEIGGSQTLGIVESVVSSGDPRAPGLRLQILVENAERVHRPGMVATIELPRVDEATVTATVPHATIFERGQLTGVFVVNERSEARLRWVALGDETGDRVRVLSGVRPGERVAVLPSPNCLSDGRAVEPVQP